MALKYYLSADTISGVREVSADDIPAGTTQAAPGVFFECLKDLLDGEPCYGIVDKKEYDRIDSEYTIR